MSVNAWRKGGAPSGTSAMMVPVNTKVRLEELLQGIIVQSGNDAAIAVAEGIAGNEDAFAKLMTEEARRIGMPKSQFRNATGLYHPEHLMTVRELAILARHIIREFPDYFPMFAQKEFLYRRHKFINRNPLLFADANVDGMKTGYVKEAGYGIVVTAKQSGRRLIAVVNGAASEAERREEAARLLDWGYTQLQRVQAVRGRRGGRPGPRVGRQRVLRAARRQRRGQRLAAAVSRRPSGCAAEIVYQGPLKAPVEKGDEVARLRVTSSSSAMQEVPLYAAEDVGDGRHDAPRA